MAAAAARCFRALPTAKSAVHLSRNRTPSTSFAADLLLRAACPPHQQATVEELLAKLVGHTGVVRADMLGCSSARNGELWAVLPTLEAVNRNARRPKKANHGKRPCSHVGRRQRRRRKNIIKNGP